ncbi:peptidase M23 [Sulfitobacter pacificus]|uniref:peptidase M23 n=1 Tax=Sulfitobacter pacificus TaxID=1499314 RepID=UPI00361C21EF
MKPVMKTALFVLTPFAASPALAHVGTHVHPHANDPSWLPVLFAGLFIAAVTTVALARRT